MVTAAANRRLPFETDLRSVLDGVGIAWPRNQARVLTLVCERDLRRGVGGRKWGGRFLTLFASEQESAKRMRCKSSL